MADVIIFLSTKQIAGKPNLYLRDSHGNNGVGSIVTKVKGGDSVFWIIDNDMAVDKFEIITTADDDCIYSAKPFQISPSQWSAVIQGDLTTGIDTYDVRYTKDQKSKINDPKLIVVPPEED
ncbi:MAG: hypothetical protein JXJ22_14960 [Bacteroidales bacterium]|nr:hypothetical protein [Bacteroidales bacterium]